MTRPSTGAWLAGVVAIVLFIGVISITVPSALLTTLGVLLVIVGLMGLMPVVRLGLADSSGEITPLR